MSDTDKQSSDGRTRVELHLPDSVVERLHEQFPEAGESNAAACRIALGEGLFIRETGREEGNETAGKK